MQLARMMFVNYGSVPVYTEFFRWLGWGERLDPMVEAYRAGDRKRALELAPDELISEIYVTGSIDQIRERLEEFVARGITTVVLAPLCAARAAARAAGGAGSPLTARARCYVASPLGFTEAGRDYYARVYLPALAEVVEPVDPWTLTGADEFAARRPPASTLHGRWRSRSAAATPRRSARARCWPPTWRARSPTRARSSRSATRAAWA